MKKIISLFLSFSVLLSLFACGGNVTSTSTSSSDIVEDTKNNFKLGIVLIGDENEGYTYSHISGIRDAVKELGLDEKTSVIYKYNIGESDAAHDACVDLAEQGCKLIITNSYGHQKYTELSATEYPDREFVAMTGDTANKSGLKNFHNAFTKIYEARYLSGVAAGLKLKELIEENKITDKNKDENGNIKIGYVGAYPFAEVVSGYTSFFLGIRSVVNEVAMQVQYTNSWGDMTAEYEAATALIGNGCVIIGQHADTTGAPSAVETRLKEGDLCYSVGYNIDMSSVAPNAALTSPTNHWANYYKQIIKAVMNGEKFATNWAEGFETDSVRYTTLTKNCAKDTEKTLEEIKNKIISGQLHVFDINTFTVDGKKVEHCFATDTDGDFTPDKDEAVFDGYYHESYFQSAPSFALRIDGIKELN